MNRYKARFNVRCPNQEHGFVGYVLVIETDNKMILVEDIKTYTTFDEPGYHEDIADFLFEKLGGKQTITATHHGVEIQTVREKVSGKIKGDRKLSAACDPTSGYYLFP